MRISFTLCKAAQTFQTRTDEVLSGLPSAFTYIDDVLIASHNLKEHYKTFKTSTFEININKCDFEVSKLSFLRHVIDKHGITPIPENIAVIQQFP